MSTTPPVKKVRRHSHREQRTFYDPNSLEEKIERFQKEAIYRQLLEYKREAQKWEADNKDNLACKEIREGQIGIVLSELQLIYDQIESLLADLGIHEDVPRFDSLELLGQILDNQIELNDFKKNLSTQRASIVSLFNHIRDFLSKLQSHTNESFSKLKTSKDNTLFQGFIEIQKQLLKELQESSHESISLKEIDSLKGEIQHLKIKQKADEKALEDKTEEIEELMNKIKVLEKSIDRLRMENEKKPKETNSDNKELIKKEVIQKLVNETMDDEQKEKYKKEIKQLRSEKAELSAQIDVLNARLNDIPESKIRSSHIYKDLLIQLNHFAHENETQRKKNAILRSEIEVLNQEKVEAIERLMYEEDIRKETIENELKKALLDVVRIRKHRDLLQAELTSYKSREELDFNEKTGMRNLFSSQEARIKLLSSDISRLRVKLAYLQKDEKAVEYIEKHPEILSIDDTLSALADLEAKNKDLKDKLDELTKILGDPPVLNNLIQHNEELSLKLKEFTKENEQLLSKVKLIEENEKDELIAKIKELETSLNTLQKQLDLKNQTEAQITSEFEGLKSEYNKLAEHHTSKLYNLSQKEDQIIALHKEKARAEQKANQCIRDSDQHQTISNTLKKQAEKLQEHIRKLEEHSKNMAFQIKTMEREINASTEARLRIEDSLKSAARSNQEYKTQYNFLSSKVSDLETALIQRNHALEDEINNKNRLSDEVESLTKKITSLSLLTDKKKDEDLERQVEEYKTLLKCTSCMLRFKSHCLLRCMHVFCKECLDKRIETRQRKCPSCNESFGAKDIKTIYL